MIEFEKIPPGLTLLFGGLLSQFFSRKTQRIISIILPLITICHIFLMREPGYKTFNFISLELFVVYEQIFSRLFAVFFALTILLINIFMFNSSNKLETTLGMVAAGAAVSISYSGDFFTAIVLLEIISATSLILIWLTKNEKTRDSGLRYIVIQLLAGLLMITGLIFKIFSSGNYSISAMNLGAEFSEEKIGIYLIFIGLLIKAATFPLSAWLADAYSNVSSSSALILTTFLTKAALFLIICMFSSSNLLIYCGLFTAFYGIIYATFENNILKMLSYSYVSQIGMALIACGVGGQGLVAAAVMATSLYFIIIFMVNSMVNFSTNARYFSEVPGFLIIKMPRLAIVTVLASLSLAAFPFTIGFLSKSIIMNSPVIQDSQTLYYIILALSALAVFHCGLKYPYFMFFSKNRDREIRILPKSMNYTIYAATFIMVVTGVVPQLIFALAPHNYEIGETLKNFYSFPEIINQTLLLAFAAFAFYILSPLVQNKNSIMIDFDWFYRILIKNIILLVYKLLESLWSILMCAIMHLKNSFARLSQESFNHGKETILVSYSISKTMLLFAIIFAIMLVLHYLK